MGRLSHPGRADSPPSPWPSPSPQSIFSLLWDVMMLLRSLPQSTKDFLASILDSMTWAILSKWFRGFHLLDFYHVPRPPRFPSSMSRPRTMALQHSSTDLNQNHIPTSSTSTSLCSSSSCFTPYRLLPKGLLFSLLCYLVGCMRC